MHGSKEKHFKINENIRKKYNYQKKKKNIYFLNKASE